MGVDEVEVHNQWRTGTANSGFNQLSFLMVPDEQQGSIPSFRVSPPR